MSDTPAPAEPHTARGPVSDLTCQLWSQGLQRRVMRLLLQHDQRLFHGQFRAFYRGSDLPKLPVFRQYDDFLTLRALSDELLDDIMPRIRRQLSLQTDQARLLEDAPTRGDIDWPRSIQRAWSETPGLPPLTFETRLRQRSTVTPENLFTVAVLLAYRALLRNVQREDLADEALSEPERQALSQADDHIERELAAAYARALIPAARQSDIAALAAQVEARLRPGPNPYRDLLDWWRRFTVAQVGRGREARKRTLSPIREDGKTDAWLYELWIMLELLHVIDGAGATAPAVGVVREQIDVAFTWEGVPLQLTYNRQADETLGSRHGWLHGPGVRPDYTIRREGALKVEHNGVTIWEEPPVILDAKYYLSGSDPVRTHAPIKKLLGDMLLMGATQCILFFPALASKKIPRAVRRIEQRHHGGMAVPHEVRLYRLDPLMPVEQLQDLLRSILSQCAETLSARPSAITCEGAWIDADSLNDRRTLPTSRVICPKPHIGPGVFDLVDPAADCLRNPKVCHVIGQPIVPPVVLRSLSGGELAGRAGELRHAAERALSAAERGGDEEHTEQLRAQIFAGVGRAVEQYVKLRGNTEAIREHFEQWVFGEHWAAHPWSLGEDVREMLVSGEYVWQEYKQLGDQLTDWAAPAVQFCRALERELKRRLFVTAEWKQYKIKGPYGWTMGTPLHAYRHGPGYVVEDGQERNVNGPHNWQVMCAYLRQSAIDDAAYATAEAAFATIIAGLAAIRIDDLRNKLAHGGPVSRESAAQIRAAVIGSRQHIGALCWATAHLRPLDI
ncbi:hypothetical protein K2Z83_26955 [Oscillochloris sp. ZM17-4]|uniref:hypothetical protein n=1 Tax=Oscillochloris sp. ZM17-4 TaxID=2866714 RepID=UPI001C73B5B9|nr:hypothetical protein [Oscillochloris sp. ZM17-4]MBX0331294.1 hypothetical protein [Oscillochloris sp. ZM17-4]